jgi:magnesium-transporting ATPase (P-type)
MAPKPSPIYAFRSGKWAIITTKDLLPGDLISISYKKRANTNAKVPLKPVQSEGGAPAAS